MRKNKMFLLMTLFSSALSASPQVNIDQVTISNAASTAIAFMGDNGYCRWKVEPLRIQKISMNYDPTLCLGTQCLVKVYANLSCSGAAEYEFNFNRLHGISSVEELSSKFLKMKGFPETIFVMDK